MTAKQSLFFETETHLLSDTAPSDYLQRVSKTPEFSEYPFSMLLALKETGQSPKYHPEGSVWNHTMMVIDAAAGQRVNSKDERVFMWSALLHDIGKPKTTKRRNGKITSYDHEKVGAGMAIDFLGQLIRDREFINKVSAMVRWHMQLLFVANGLPYANITLMKQQADIHEIALLGLCDRMGRLGAELEQEKENVALFLWKCGSQTQV